MYTKNHRVIIILSQEKEKYTRRKNFLRVIYYSPKYTLVTLGAMSHMNS